MSLSLSAIEGKADITWTCRMSAFDPKRTLEPAKLDHKIATCLDGRPAFANGIGNSSGGS